MRRVAIAIAALALMLTCLCFTVSVGAVSGVASWAVGFYGLTQYAEGNNEWIVKLDQTCEKKRPARRGRSHNQPEWTGY